ncbi:MAG TPA: hypothetical protein PLV45_04135 [bacterium]|nr:hypothetical protein [bacterium]
MINKQQIKDEIDNVKDEDLLIVYRIVQALAKTPSMESSPKRVKSKRRANWYKFLDNMFGCMSDDPIVRGTQGEIETRDAIE